MNITLELELPLSEVAELFKRHGWLYASEGCYGLPGAAELEAQIRRLTTELHGDGAEVVMSSAGRLAVVKDPFVDGTYEVLLSLGYLATEPEEEDNACV